MVFKVFGLTVSPISSLIIVIKYEKTGVGLPIKKLLILKAS